MITVRPVSYTHLDVYKRQMQGFAAVTEDGEPPQECFWADRDTLDGCAIPGAFAAYRDQVPEWMEKSSEKEEKQ